MGFTVDDVAQLLQVTPRTVQLWISGRVRLPFMAVKLIRLYLRYELPGDAWNGWVISAGRLYTPEGYELHPKDFTWWSLLVRKARAFHGLYDQLNANRTKDQLPASGEPTALDAPSASGAWAQPGLVPSINNAETAPLIEPVAQGNQQLTQSDITGVEWYQTDHKLISPCPTRSDSLPRSTKKRAPTQSVSESVSTPLSRWPSMPTCGDRLTHLLPQQNHPNDLAPSPRQAPALAHKKHPPRASRTGVSSTRTPTCGHTSIQSLPIDSLTTSTRVRRSRLSLSTGRLDNGQQTEPGVIGEQP